VRSAVRRYKQWAWFSIIVEVGATGFNTVRLGLGKAFDLYKTCAKGSLPEQIGEENRRRWDWLIDVQRKTDVKMFVMVSIKVFFHSGYGAARNRTAPQCIRSGVKKLSSIASESCQYDSRDFTIVIQYKLQQGMADSARSLHSVHEGLVKSWRTLDQSSRTGYNKYYAAGALASCITLQWRCYRIATRRHNMKTTLSAKLKVSNTLQRRQKKNQGNMHRKFDEVRASGFWDMDADWVTRSIQYCAPLPAGKRSIVISVSVCLSARTHVYRFCLHQ